MREVNAEELMMMMTGGGGGVKKEERHCSSLTIWQVTKHLVM